MKYTRIERPQGDDQKIQEQLRYIDEQKKRE